MDICTGHYVIKQETAYLKRTTTYTYYFVIGRYWERARSQSEVRFGWKYSHFVFKNISVRTVTVRRRESCIAKDLGNMA